MSRLATVLLLTLLGAVPACSGIFGPEDVLQDFEMNPVDREQGAFLDAPTAEVRGGAEQITVEGLVIQSGCSRLEPAAEKSGSTVRFRIRRSTGGDEACPTFARPVRYRARLGPLEEGEYRLRVTLPGLGTDLKSATFVFSVDVSRGLTG